jgi:hypothetical protein
LPSFIIHDYFGSFLAKRDRGLGSLEYFPAAFVDYSAAFGIYSAAFSIIPAAFSIIPAAFQNNPADVNIVTPK